MCQAYDGVEANSGQGPLHKTSSVFSDSRAKDTMTTSSVALGTLGRSKLVASDTAAGHRSAGGLRLRCSDLRPDTREVRNPELRE